MAGYVYGGAQRGLTTKETTEDQAAERTAQIVPDPEGRRRVLEAPGGWICPRCRRGYRSDQHRRGCLGRAL